MKKFLFLLIAAVVTVGISLRQGEGQEVTLSESIQPDGTKVETIHLSAIPDSQLKGKDWSWQYYVKDPLISPPISLALGERMIIRMVGSDEYDSFFFDPNANKLSTLTPTRARDGLQNNEPWLTGTWHYYKYWTATALGSCDLVFDSDYNVLVPDGDDPGYLNYSLILKVSVTVVE